MSFPPKILVVGRSYRDKHSAGSKVDWKKIEANLALLSSYVGSAVLFVTLTTPTNKNIIKNTLVTQVDLINKLDQNKTNIETHMESSLETDI